MDNAPSSSAFSHQVDKLLSENCQHLLNSEMYTVQDSSDPERISGFAEELASCLLKETIAESGAGEQEWSIPCSSECHQTKPGQNITSVSVNVDG